MDERAQNIRLLMKQQQNRAMDNSLSGKDKAKLLKAMKSENNSQVGTAVSRGTGTLSSHTQSTTTTKPPQLAASSSSSSNQKSVPKGFYDDDDDNYSSSAKLVPAGASKASAVAATITTKSNGKSAASNLPVGFYDDPEQDMVAHGISKYEFEQGKEKVQTEDLSLFLGEIEQITEETGIDEALETEQQSKLQEDDDDALQMTYMVKLAALLQKSSQVNTASSSKGASKSEQTGSTTLTDIDNVLAEAENVSAMMKVDAAGSERLMASTTTTISQVADIMRKKRKVSAVDPYASILQNNHSSIGSSKRIRAAADQASSNKEEKSVVDRDSEDRSSGEEDEDSEEEYNPMAFF